MHYFDEKIRTIVQNVAKEGSEIFLEFPLMLSNSLTSIFFRTSAICILHIVGHSKLNYKMIYVSYPWKIVEFHSFSLISNFLFDNGQSKHKKGLSYTRLSGNGWFDLHRSSIYTFFNINSLSIQVFEHTITEHTDIWTNIISTYTVLKKPWIQHAHFWKTRTST